MLCGAGAEPTTVKGEWTEGRGTAIHLNGNKKAGAGQRACKRIRGKPSAGFTEAAEERRAGNPKTPTHGNRQNEEKTAPPFPTSGKI